MAVDGTPLDGRIPILPNASGRPEVVIPINPDGSPSGVVTAATGTVTSVADSATSVPIIAANPARKGVTITNTASTVLYIRCATGAATTTTGYTYRVAQNASVDIPNGYVGVINGIWATDANDGSALVTEFT